MKFAIPEEEAIGFYLRTDFNSAPVLQYFTNRALQKFILYFDWAWCLSRWFKFFHLPFVATDCLLNK